MAWAVVNARVAVVPNNKGNNKEWVAGDKEMPERGNGAIAVNSKGKE